MIMAEFAGSLILEILNQNNLLEDFYEAVDSDNLGKVKSILKQVHISEEDIKEVITLIENGDLD